MKNLSVWVLICFFMAAGIFPACSGKDDGAEEKGAIEKMTDDAAKKAADKILAPVENARDAKDLGDKHMDQYQQVMDE